jgi:LacI family transcriptional regulator
VDPRQSAATLNDVARAAGVHPSTVSRALDPARQHLLSPETRSRVAQVAESLGYQVNTLARSLRTGSTGLLGVVAPDVANPFIGQFLSGVEDVLHGTGRMLLIAESHDDSATLAGVLQQMVTRRLDALIVTAARRGDEASLTRAAAAVPVVLAVRSLESGGLPTIIHDDRLGARLAAEHLVQLGHERLAQLRGSDDISSFRERSIGFADFLARSSARDVSLPEVASEPSVEQGRTLTARLLEIDPRERPTAIFAHNDLLAVGALSAIADRGLRCPEDISVVGYNDSPLTDHLAPPLTTVRVPTAEMGVRAGRLVTALLAGTDAHIDEPPRPELVIRRSTAAPRVI